MFFADLLEFAGEFGPQPSKALAFVLNMTLLDYRSSLVKRFDQLDQAVMLKVLKLLRLVDPSVFLGLAARFQSKCSARDFAAFLEKLHSAHEPLFLQLLEQTLLGPEARRSAELVLLSFRILSQMSEDVNSEMGETSFCSDSVFGAARLGRFVILFRVFDCVVKAGDSLSALPKAAHPGEPKRGQGHPGPPALFELKDLARFERSLRLIKSKVFLHALHFYKRFPCAFSDLRRVCYAFEVLFGELVRGEPDLVVGYVVQRTLFRALCAVFESSEIFRAIRKSNGKAPSQLVTASHVLIDFAERG